MWTHPVFKAALALYVAWGAWHWYSHRPVHPPDGILAAADPAQGNLPAGILLHQGHWTLTPRATYSVTARVLAIERYHFDAIADLVPADAALGWGPMSDNRILKDIEVTQDHRFYFWHTARAPPLPPAIINTHSANTHLIPASKTISRLIARLRPGQVVHLTGTLVDGQRDDGLTVHTSLTRTDQGAGACEIMLVTDIAF